MQRRLPWLLTVCLLAFLTSACASERTLKTAYRRQFLVGTALTPSHFAERNGRETDLIASQFNAITAENAMKWQSLHPWPGQFRFDAADRFVAFGERHRMFIVGHTLVWHSQIPQWVFLDDQGNPVSRDVLLERMRDHIHTVVGRYKGRVKGWDVVNEALNEDGSMRDSPWRRIIGDDYIVKAFQFAHEADPDAELYYNDYAIERKAKREGAVRILKSLQAAGVPVTGVGIQEHVNLNWPTARDLEETITTFAGLGLKVMITELDVDVLPARAGWDGVSADLAIQQGEAPALNPYPNGLPEPMQQQLAHRYADLFAIYVKHADAIERVTFWGVTDDNSWLNGFPIRGRTNYPLLFDRNGRPKPAYQAVLDTAPFRFWR